LSVFDKKRISLLSDTTKIRYTWSEADRNYLPGDARRKIIKFGRLYRFREVEISKAKKEMLHIYLSVEFIETNDGYKFFGINHIKRPECCR
jgi:hypothetical protein